MPRFFNGQSIVKSEFHHGLWHTPPEQVSPGPQTRPHPPQCDGSKAVLVQNPLQLVNPPEHPPHTPWLQIGVDAGQTFPQAPQLCGSELTAVHVPLQHAVPVAQQA